MPEAWEDGLNHGSHWHRREPYGHALGMTPSHFLSGVDKLQVPVEYRPIDTPRKGEATLAPEHQEGSGAKSGTPPPPPRQSMENRR
jgi:hypothetical protein